MKASKNEKLTQKRLKELLSYDPDTGIFIRKISTGRHKCHKKGEVAGCEKGGYNRIGVDGFNYKAHRLAVLYTDGVHPKRDVDHFDQVKNNNRRLNIREVSNQCNSRNVGNKKNNTSGVKGVYWHKQRSKWAARIRINYRWRSLGLYNDFCNAACARLAGEQCVCWEKSEPESPAFKYVQNMLGRNHG